MSSEDHLSVTATYLRVTPQLLADSDWTGTYRLATPEEQARWAARHQPAMGETARYNFARFGPRVIRRRKAS